MLALSVPQHLFFSRLFDGGMSLLIFLFVHVWPALVLVCSYASLGLPMCARACSSQVHTPTSLPKCYACASSVSPYTHVQILSMEEVALEDDDVTIPLALRPPLHDPPLRSLKGLHERSLARHIRN